MTEQTIEALEKRIFDLTRQLHALYRAAPGAAVPDYTFDTLDGQVTLLDLFGERQRLMMIHNMGQGCRYCTLWADGFNGFVPHLESTLALVLVSRDAPALQRQFANSRGWRYRLASHAGGAYIREQTVQAGATNMPGAVVYERRDGQIFRRASCVFGPGDQYCSMWNLLGLAGLGEADWTPQFNYWRRPPTLDDGGENVLA
jgi:predicted dithiol-disulfide oxidoreductase (DUF899 family)